MPFKKNRPVSRSSRDATEIKNLSQLYETVDASQVKTFADLPLSSYTQDALKEADFTEPTEIQRESVLLALRGLDVLGAAKTGSGKTLAFVVPLLERLYASRWSREMGLGALVITPTRELAYQIFETLRKVGKNHDFSAGLVIGGKDIKYETERLATCNIVICTPGRLLQHMDENPQFDASQVQILVLDEADRCLDMGFAPTMNAIMENLPTRETSGRQTLLFSATQTRSVKDLARLSLNEPVYVSVHEHSAHATPDQLAQNYIVCDLEDKVNMMWSFVKSHKRKKMLVFVQSCKQAKYLTELFKRLRCGTAVIGLYGTLHQLRRMAIYDEFCQRDQAVMFATDIAARGLDFPSVDWVVQYDCPEDATTYLHRVGRTARNAAVGQSLLVLLPNEEPGMAQQLRAHKIPIEKIEVNPKKMSDIQRKIQAHLASDTALKESAQRAFQSYLKSVFLLKNKHVFDVLKLDTAKFANSLGLAVPPRVRFLQRQLKNKEGANGSGESSAKQPQSKEQQEQEEEKPSKPNNNVTRLVSDSEDEDGEDDVLTMKRKDHEIELGEGEGHEDDLGDLEGQSMKKGNQVITKAALAKKVLKKNIRANQQIHFDEETGEGVDADAKLTGVKQSKEGKDYEKGEMEGERGGGGGGIDIAQAKAVLKAEDKFDRQMEKQRVRQRKLEEKRKLKEAKLKRRKGEQTEATGSGEEGESESEGEEPNLDWLPDPDKIYGKEKQGDESSDENNGDDSGDEDDDDVTSSSDESDDETKRRSSSKMETSQKRKWKPPKKQSKTSGGAKKMKRSEDNDDVTSTVGKLDVKSAEELALQLLKS